MITALVEYLTMFYQTGNMAQMEVIARSMLAAIPDDLVALQFLGLALYQSGRVDDAYRALTKVADRLDNPIEQNVGTDCESASAASYRAATREQSGLADGWYRIALVLNSFGFHNPATRAFEAASASRGLPGAAGQRTGK